MSIGGIVGAFVGGVVGFFIGGPAGALYGASIGFSLGMIVDPMTPDIPSVGAPLPEGVEIMPSTIGVPVPDLAGTAKVTGHLLCYGKEQTVTLYAESPDSGKGGDEPDPQVSGYEYYMSWAVGICTGPIDTIYAIYKGDEVVWEGELNIPTASGTYGQETIVLTEEGPESGSVNPFEGVLPFGEIDWPEEFYTNAGMGVATFYFGTNDQIVNSNVGDIIGDDTLNSPYRNFCWCFFDNCYIGKFNRCPTMKFVVRKTPEVPFLENSVVQIYDHNPISTIWYILHNLTGLSEAWLHTDDFVNAATTIATEGRGTSCFFSTQKNSLNYLESINKHIDCIIRYGSDGKFHPKLIRDDYNVDDLVTVDENVLLEDPTLSRKSWIDTINEIKVQYTEIPRTFEFPQGPWKAAMSPLDSTYIYVYDITYKSVVKLNTEILPPVCKDALVITENNLDYDMGYGNPGAQRGGYCMSPDGDRLWYLIRDGLNCELVEVDISGYSMNIVNTTNFSSLLASGEEISDGCSDGTYTYWSTTLVAGRVIKIKNSDHSINLDITFNYPQVGVGVGGDSCIKSLTVEGSSLYWIYSRDHMGCTPEYNACRHWVKSGNDLVQDFDVIYCDSGVPAPYWQNLIRYIDGHLYIHQAYHPSCGTLYQTNKSFIGTGACELYLQNIMGIYNDQIFILTYDPPYTTYLKCVAFSDLEDLSSIDVSQYTGHPNADGYTWTSTSAMSTYGSVKAVSLFRYDEVNESNIVTCFGANELLLKLTEGVVRSSRVIEYGS